MYLFWCKILVFLVWTELRLRREFSLYLVPFFLMFRVQGPVPKFQPYKGSVMMDSFVLRHKHEYVILIYKTKINNSYFCRVFFLNLFCVLCFSYAFLYCWHRFTKFPHVSISSVTKNWVLKKCISLPFKNMHNVISSSSMSWILFVYFSENLMFPFHTVLYFTKF